MSESSQVGILKSVEKQQLASQRFAWFKSRKLRMCHSAVSANIKFLAARQLDSTSKPMKEGI